VVQPSAEHFERLVQARADAPAAIPVYREILADLDTPVSAFLKVADTPYAFLLESVEGGEQWARYSFIGLNPAFVIRARGRQCELVKDGWVARSEERDDPLAFVEEVLGEWQPVDVEGLPPFAGGAVGWLGWDAVRWWEKLPSPHDHADDPPTMVFAVPRTLLIFDNLRHRILVVEVVLTRQGVDPRLAHAQAVKRIDAVIGSLREGIPARPPRKTTRTALTALTERASFEAGVEQIKESIRAGDCIQVVLSQRFELGYTGDAFDLYRALRAVNPSPYMFCLRFPEATVIGSSPETMVRVQDGSAFVAPIAGTRRRGTSPEQDRDLEHELLADPKERAEHVMLVDLARNDLGRVAAPGTVQVEDLMHVERFSHVMHIVSGVTAELAEGRTALDAVRAALPAGTLSGAPKVRAMQIIDELETRGRQLYGGAVGYLGFGGNVDLAITIRTAWSQGDAWYLQVGAGIVADSDPASEHQECLNKAGGLIRALELAQEGL